MRGYNKEEFKNLLGRRIKELRENKKLTQQQLAFKMGFKDKQVVNRYENDGANPTIFSLLQICDALEVSISELLDF